jgi:hypothetical protein
MVEMTDQSPEEPEHPVQERRAYTEAAERAKRLHAWLGGVLSGGPTPSHAQSDRRQTFAIPDAPAENFAGDTQELPAERPEPIGDPLLKCRNRIRERRELAGTPQLEIVEDERERRSAQIIESFLVDRAAGREPTPLHLILAARYIEGEMDSEQYGSAVRDV